MSSNDDQPVDYHEVQLQVVERIAYQVVLDGDARFTVSCTDFREDGGYMRFMDGPIPAAIVPLPNFRCAYRLEPTT